MNKTEKMASTQKLLMFSDTVFLDHRQAQRSAYLGMIDYIAKKNATATALVAQALQHPPTLTDPADTQSRAANHPDAKLLYETAKSAVAAYVARRSEATRPPEGFAEAVATVRSNLKMRGDGSGEIVVGVSTLPPAALERFTGGGGLRQNFDHIYSLQRSATGTGITADPGGDGWIRPLPTGTKWPSPAVMRAICATHHIQPKDAVLIGGNLADEVEPALELGMKAVYVRRDIMDAPPSETDNQHSATSRRPDGIVTRIQDLPKLPVFLPPRGHGENQALRVAKIDKRNR